MGYVVGLGAEKMLSDRMSVTGEYEYSNFGKTEVDLGGGITTRALRRFPYLDDALGTIPTNWVSKLYLEGPSGRGVTLTSPAGLSSRRPT